MIREWAVLDPKWQKVTLVLVGAVIFGIHAVALLSARKGWLWTYSLVVIALGVGSCFFLVCIPMLVYWVRPDTKQYFSHVTGVDTA